mmetsp:Transcript_20072/g.42845  ORF Transcript_20072/g.42845 Transcript_20072/m.42845 type:complete len:267 (+) Transcript_20072:819-1619(+)
MPACQPECRRWLPRLLEAPHYGSLPAGLAGSRRGLPGMLVAPHDRGVEGDHEECGRSLHEGFIEPCNAVVPWMHGCGRGVLARLYWRGGRGGSFAGGSGAPCRVRQGEGGVCGGLCGTRRPGASVGRRGRGGRGGEVSGADRRRCCGRGRGGRAPASPPTPCRGALGPLQAARGAPREGCEGSEEAHLRARVGYTQDAAGKRLRAPEAEGRPLGADHRGRGTRQEQGRAHRQARGGECQVAGDDYQGVAGREAGRSHSRGGADLVS